MKYIHRIKNYINRMCHSQMELFIKEGGIMGEGCEIHGKIDFGSEPYLIELGNYVRLSDGVIFSTHDGGMWVLRNLNMLPDADCINRIVVGNNVQIGYRVIINQGVRIGDNCIIASGSIVTHDVPSNSIVAGVPAKVIETIYDYYTKKKEVCIYTKNMAKEEKEKFLLRYFRSLES